MGQIEDKSRHIPWEARAFPGGHPTHYEKGYMYEAMLLMRDHRKDFDEIIRNLCSFVNESPRLPNSETLAKFWVDELAEKMLPSFLKDNPNLGFTEEKVREVYGANISDFFSNIHKLISNQNPSTELDKLTPTPIKSTNINTGWTALLREYGLFNTMSSYIYQIINRSFGNNIIHQSIMGNISAILPDDIFISHGVQCPAASQVQNHLALCIGLNAGLIKRKLYSSENHISILENDEMNHFKSVEKMCTEYDSKIRRISIL